MSYEDCKACKLSECPPDCFDNHPGSRIAMEKLAKKLNKNVHLVGFD